MSFCSWKCCVYRQIYYTIYQQQNKAQTLYFCTLELRSKIYYNKEKVIYIDPFKVDKAYNDADLIFITHNHYDHYSEEDIDKVKKESTYYIVPKDLQNNLINRGIEQEKIIAGDMPAGCK